MTAPDPLRPRRLPYVLLILMTIATFGGPIAIGVVLRGGPSRTWPPDRSVEWATLLGVSGLVVALMVLAVAAAVANQRAVARLRAARGEGPGSGSDPA